MFFVTSKPDKKGRLDILNVHAQKVTLDPQLSLGTVAAITPGFTGADLANLVNEAAIVATRRKADSVTLADFTAAVERSVAGLEKRNRVLTPQEHLAVAHHEMGHVLVALALPDGDTVHKVSIVARGIGSLGYLQALIPLLPIETSWNIKEVRYPAVAKFLREHRAGIQAAKRSKRSEW